MAENSLATRDTSDLLFDLDRKGLIKALTMVVAESVNYVRTKETIQKRQLSIFGALNAALKKAEPNFPGYSMDTGQLYAAKHLGDDFMDAIKYYKDEQASVAAQVSAAQKRNLAEVAKVLQEYIALNNRPMPSLTTEDATPHGGDLPRLRNQIVKRIEKDSEQTLSEQGQRNLDALLHKFFGELAAEQKHRVSVQEEYQQVLKLRHFPVHGSRHEMGTLWASFLYVRGGVKRSRQKLPKIPAEPDAGPAVSRFVEAWNAGVEGEMKASFFHTDELKAVENWQQKYLDSDTDEQKVDDYLDLSATQGQSKLFRTRTSHSDTDWREADDFDAALSRLHRQLVNDVNEIRTGTLYYQQNQAIEADGAAGTFYDYYFSEQNFNDLFWWYRVRDLYQGEKAAGKLVTTLLPEEFRPAVDRENFDESIATLILMINYLKDDRAESWKELINLYNNEQYHQDLLKRLDNISSKIMKLQEKVVLEADQTRAELGKIQEGQMALHEDNRVAISATLYLNQTMQQGVSRILEDNQITHRELREIHLTGIQTQQSVDNINEDMNRNADVQEAMLGAMVMDQHKIKQSINGGLFL